VRVYMCVCVCVCVCELIGTDISENRTDLSSGQALKMKTLACFETSETALPKTQHHIHNPLNFSKTAVS